MILWKLSNVESGLDFVNQTTRTRIYQSFLWFSMKKFIPEESNSHPSIILFVDVSGMIQVNNNMLNMNENTSEEDRNDNV